jgi:O-antigen ligase
MLAWLSGMAVALAWLQPWAPPPAPAVPGLVTAWAMSGLLWLGIHRWRPAWPAAASASSCLTLLACLLGLSLWSIAWVPFVDRALMGGLWGSVLCIFVAYLVGRQADMVTPIAQSLLWVALTCAVMGWVQYAGWAQTPGDGFDWLHASPQRDAYANLRQRNQFGSLMALGLAAWLYLQPPSWQRIPLFHWLQLGLLSLGAVISCSRAGAISWLALATVVAVGWGKYRWRAQGSAWMAPVVAASLFVLLSAALPNVTPLETQATATPAPAPALTRATTQAEGLDICESRLVLWRNVLALSLQRPWTGWGWGELDYAMATQPLTGTRFCGIVAHAHNLPLQLMVEWGWPIAWGLMACAGVWLWRRRPHASTSSKAWLGWALLLPLTVHSLLEFPLWYGPFQMTLGLALGMVKGPAEDTVSSKARTVTLGLAVLLAAGAVWGAFDYLRVSQPYVPSHLRMPHAQRAPWVEAEKTFWFRNASDFVQLTFIGVPQEDQKALAERLMHYSPEPAVSKYLQDAITQPHQGSLSAPRE